MTPLLRPIIEGAWRFGVVSLLGFGVWAAEPYIPGVRGGGEVVLYLACLVIFVGASEILLPPLLNPPEQRRKFNRSFVPAFIAYAVTWSICWFALRFGAGEWLGSALGCAVFAVILGQRLGARSGYIAAILCLIAFHSGGYFLGGYVFSLARQPPAFLEGLTRGQIWTLAKLAWGLFYGIGFGAGIGYAFHRLQR